jgi:hypothetical protein
VQARSESDEQEREREREKKGVSREEREEGRKEN